MPMYQFPCSLVALFPESVYKNAGVADVLPLVMQSLDPDKVQCVQFLRAGRVRLTFDDPESCAAVLKSGLDLGDVAVQLFPADERVRLVHLRDLPIEVSHDAVSSFFSTYGEVLSVDHCYFDEFPSVRNGNRLIKILLTQDIPYFIEIESYNCRAWYRRQPSQCSICREFGHRAQACSLSGRCRRCHQPGHVARECTQAWGLPPPVPIDVDVDGSCTSDSTIVPDPVSAVTTDKTSDPELPPHSVSAVITDKTSDPEPPPDPVPVPVKVSDPRVDVAAVDSVKVSDKQSVDVCMTTSTKTRGSKVSAKMFCARLSKFFGPVRFPEFDATGQEWDSKAKAHLRLHVKAVFGSKDMAINNSDICSWSENDLSQISTLLCEMLSVRHDYLVDFVLGTIKWYWRCAKNPRKRDS